MPIERCWCGAWIPWWRRRPHFEMHEVEYDEFCRLQGWPRGLTPEEAEEMFDMAARTRLGMSGDEFREAFARGEFGHGDPRHSRGIQVAMIMPHRPTDSARPAPGGRA